MLSCTGCEAQFPILAGVAVVVQDVHSYLLAHVKGISKLVPDVDIPSEILEEYLEAKEEIAVEHIEEDLEAERVVALYLMNHYLDTRGESWWQPREAAPDPLLDRLIREHWDQGPMARIGDWMKELALPGTQPSFLELGCGVGGLHRKLQPQVGTYLGVDGSFASIALARHLALGVPYAGKIRVPEDLLQGSVSREVPILPASAFDGKVDFVVGDLDHPPVAPESWDFSAALNAIDMLVDPAELPRQQHALLKRGGVALQSCPYIWHENVSRGLRARLPATIRDSASAVEWLYSQAGFRVEKKADHIPWLFFKHVRQLEIYSVHLFAGRKA